ncbi:adipocyte plasma membrane-associated protein-like [Babylonia areolata]|uniref:adipocyte plasma membrane-associated protein-like n=1 Tax=Babylonia areolata TaxID=304850 RepID=UPI003FCFA903
MAAPLTSIAAILQSARVPNPRVVSLGAPPPLTGVLDPNPNSWLAKAKRYANHQVPGPQSMVIADEHVFTGLSDGWVVEVKPVRPNGEVKKILRMSTRDCDTSASEETCGRPLGIRMDNQGFLIVADPYKGIYKINPATGQFEQLVDAKSEVNNLPLGYINDLCVASDGMIFFSSSSARWNHAQKLNILLEAEKTGRVLVYNPHERDPAQRVKELVIKLSFPDGLQLSQNETFLLVAERATAKIYKAHVADTPKLGTIELFAGNLPGFVNNIRLSPRGTYWVGLSQVRHRSFPSLLDRFGTQPEKRVQYMDRPASEVLQTEFPRHGMALELDDQGRILRSLQDPSGTVFSSVSEVQEHGNFLFVASPDRDYLGLLRLSDIPQASLPTEGPVDQVTDTPNTTTPKPAVPTTTTPPQIDPVTQMLSRVAQRLKAMNGSEVRGILVKLVLMLIDAAVDTKRAAARLVKAENELMLLRYQFHRGLTEHQKSLIRRSWQAYSTGPGVLEDTAVIFFRFFNDTPDAVRLFSRLGLPTGGGGGAASAAAVVNEASLMNNTEFVSHVARVAQTLQSAVSQLDHPGVLADMFRNLGARHAGYGVQSKYIPSFKAGIFQAMETRLGSSFTLEIRQAWESLLDILFDHLKQGLGNAKRK